MPASNQSDSTPSSTPPDAHNRSLTSKGKQRRQEPDLQQYVEDLDSDNGHEYQALLPRSSRTTIFQNDIMGVPEQPYGDTEPVVLDHDSDKDQALGSGFDKTAKIDKERLSGSVSLTDYVPLGREHLSDKVPPSDKYEGKHRWDPEATWTKAEERKLVRKIDFWLLSVVCVMFIGLQLDRGNLGNAATGNLMKDIGINQNEYNNGSTSFASWLRSFFYPATASVPFADDSVTGRVSAMASIPHLISFLLHSRSSLNLARVFSSLLAAAILPLRGTAGKPGWFWLFIIEGLLTCVVAIFSYLWLPVSPVDTNTFIVRKGWFTEREEIIAVNRILRDDPAKGLSSVKNAIVWKDVREAWTDPAIWGLLFIGLIAYIPQNPVQAYLNLSLKRMGYTTFQSNMLGIPSAVLQIITMLLLSYSSDYFKERTWHCFFGEAWSLPCLAALLALPDGGREWGRFALITLIAGYPYFHPIMTSWISENSFSVKKRSISVATYNIIVQWGSIVGSQIYRKDDVPYYHRGNKILIALCAASLVAYVLNYFWIGHLNKKKSQTWEVMTQEERVAYQEDLPAREADGNRRLDIRYSR
ncbi:hypothetical protein QFC22_003799 [Naganishia vaughanmartiniae]|uniref:Uncharacterized protein n=1 Tax=Naganishia vaughanmartiniae TaxID=1424756 RepID=A0ACC2X5C3_9TREE|nr:hypothetical protein QFC22_003799 [Naganishia vaughanmartiniae]